MTADLPTADLLPLRRSTSPAVRDAAYAELRRRLDAEGPHCTRPADLAAALGVPERSLRRVLDELDAATPTAPVVVGWVRARGGGGVVARNALKTGRDKKSTEGRSKK